MLRGEESSGIRWEAISNSANPDLPRIMVGHARDGMRNMPNIYIYIYTASHRQLVPTLGKQVINDRFIPSPIDAIAGTVFHIHTATHRSTAGDIRRRIGMLDEPWRGLVVPTCIARPCELGMHERFWKGPVSYKTRTSHCSWGIGKKKPGWVVRWRELGTPANAPPDGGIVTKRHVGK